MCCTAGGVSFAEVRATCFRGTESSAGPKAGGRSWNGRSANKPWRSIFEGVLAAHRGSADAAGVDWKSAVYRKVQEEVKAHCGLTVARIVELARVNREGLQRKAAPLGPRLSTARRVRSPSRGQKKAGGRYAAALAMSFFRHPELFPSDGDAGSKAGVPAHCWDEFPVGYSSADCAPAGSASALPAAFHIAVNSSCRSMTFNRTAHSVLTVCLSSGGKPKWQIVIYAGLDWGR